jgi:hypothetical protein
MTKHDTALAKAFRKAGGDPDEARLRALVIKNQDHPMGLWMVLRGDKRLATAAMRLLIAHITGSASPAVDVTPQVRERRAAERVAVVAHSRQLAKSVLAQFKLLDGSLLAERQWFELDTIAEQSETQARVVRAVKAFARPADTSVRVGDVLKAKDFDNILANAAISLAT